MGNFGKFDFAENIQREYYSLDNILDEIIEFNNDYGFIESYANSVKQKTNKLLLCDEFFDDDRLKKTEEILRFGTFLFQVILDNSLKSDFYGELKNGEEKNKSISDQLEYLEDLGNINSIYMNNLIEDYKKRSLYQSLLSKFIITNYTPELSISSLQNVQNFSVIEDAWNESFKALKVIMDSESFESHHETHLRLLAKFLKECLENANKMIFNELKETKKQYDDGKIDKIYRNSQHEKFVTNFFNKAHARRYLIYQIVSEKKDEN